MQPEQVVKLSVKVKPRAKTSRVLRAEGLSVEVALAAAPVDGAANAALLELLAEVLGVRLGALRLRLGKSARQKLVEVSGLPSPEVVARLSRAAESPRR